MICGGDDLRGSAYCNVLGMEETKKQKWKKEKKKKKKELFSLKLQCRPIH